MRAYYQLGKKIVQSNFWQLCVPYRLSFILTYKCNFRCKICNIWAKEEPEEMALCDIEKFFSKNNYISWLNLGGGEIFLREDINEIADIVYTKLDGLLLLDFATTGFFTDRVLSFVRNAEKYKPRKLLITVSLDGPKEFHDWVRGVPDSWNRAITTFKELRLNKSASIQPYLGYTLSQYNFDKFFETLEAVRKEIPDIDPNEFHLNLAQPSEFYYQNKGLFDAGWAFSEKDKIINILDEFLKLKKRQDFIISFLENTYQDKLKSFLSKAKTPLPCEALSSSCFIDPCWNIYPCIAYDRIIANIKEHDFDLRSVWKLEAKRKARKDISEYLCPNCWTPCEAYQSILSNLLPKFHRG